MGGAGNGCWTEKDIRGAASVPAQGDATRSLPGSAPDNYPSAVNGMNLDVGFLTSTPRGFPPGTNGRDPP